MKKLYYLATCSTCKRIIQELPSDELTLQDIKSQPITPEQLDQMAKLAGSYEALFSRRAMKFRALGLQHKSLSEEDYRTLILDEYTFLKRPVLVADLDIFIGNSKKNVLAMSEALS